MEPSVRLFHTLIPTVASLVSAAAGCAAPTAALAQPPEAQEAPATAPASDPNNTGHWQLISELSDEFDGEDFDRSVWHNLGENGDFHGQWKGRPPSQYNPDNIRVSDGYLYLTSRWQPDYEFAEGGPRGNATSDIGYGAIAPVTTAALFSKASFKYGYMEMRAKKADGPISSSYWTTGPGGETDAFESFGHNPNNPWSERKLHTSFHDWRQGSETYGKRIWDHTHILDFRVSGDFNVYGFEWDPDYIAIYINGGLIECVTREELGNKWVANAPHRVWIDSEIFDWEVAPEDLKPEQFSPDGIDFVVDYARVFQRRDGAKGPGCPNRKNLVANHGFENGLHGWIGEAQLSARAYSGEVAAVLEKGQTIEQHVVLEPDTTYLLSAVISSDDTNLRNIWRNAFLGVKDHGGASNSVKFFFPYFQKRSLQFRTGPEAEGASVYITNAPHGGRTRIDDVILTKLKLNPKD